MKIAPLALSIALPLALVAGALAALGAPGERPITNDAKALEERLAREKAPEVILLGNSKVRTDIDLPALRKALGSGPVVELRVEATSAPTWYAVLENRVFAAGHKPKLVVVYGPLSRILETQPQGEIDRQRLEAQLGPVEPVIDRKVFGREGDGGLLDRARNRRTELHGALMEGVKDFSVGLFFGKPDEADVLARGKAVADPALDKVFGEGASLADADQRRVIPIVEREAAARTGGTRAPADTLVPDFVALAEANGARIVFVRAPIPPSNVTEDAVSAETVKKTLDVLNAGGAGWVDLSRIGLPETAYKDSLHMNKKGRDVLTAELAARLVGMDALGSGPMPVARAPVAPDRVERVGTPPTLETPGFARSASPCGYVAGYDDLEGVSDGALATLGVGMLSPVRVLQDGVPLRPHAARADFAEKCAGAFVHFPRELRASPTDSADAAHTFTLDLAPDLPLRNEAGHEAWWVYPGTAVRLAFDEPWDAGRGPLVVEVEARVIGAGAPTVRVAGEERALEGEGDDRTVRVSVPAPPTGPWTVEIASPAEGPWVAIERVAVGEGAERVHLIGREPAPVRLTQGRTTWTGTPPTLAHGDAVEVRSEKLRALALPGLDFLADEVLSQRLGVADCSPVRLFADGKKLTAPHAPVHAIEGLGGGRYHHAADALLFGAPHELAPAGAAYTAALDPERKCESGLWLYPGDTLVGLAIPKELGTLGHGASRLALTAHAFHPADATPEPLHVRLKVKDEVRVDADVPVDRLDGTAVVFPLEPALSPRTTRVELEISTPTDGAWVLLSLATLDEERGPVAVAEVQP